MFNGLIPSIGIVYYIDGSLLHGTFQMGTANYTEAK